MAKGILIIGESGSGKSTSLRNVDPETTFLINIANKDLPFAGSSRKFTEYDSSKKTGNMKTTNSPTVILAGYKLISEMKHIKLVVVDDFQYLMSNEFMDRAKEKGYDKFTEIAQNAYNVIVQAMKILREDQKVIFLAHSDEAYNLEGTKKTKIKTIGKLLDEKITIEGLFTVVLLSQIEQTEEGLKYWFITNSDGTSTAKSPMGMFPMKIPNDLNEVVNQINLYNQS